MGVHNSSAPGSHSEKPKRSRRKFLALGGAAAAAAAGAAAAGLGLPGRAAQAAAGDPLILGQGNSAGNQGTTLTASVSSLPVFQGVGLLVRNVPSPGDGQALQGWGGEIGVLGASQGGVTGVGGISLADSGWPNLGSGNGVSGVTRTGVGVAGVSVSQWSQPFENPPAGPGVGVVGASGSGAGVVGLSQNVSGVFGVTHGQRPEDGAIGVLGVSFKPGVDLSDNPFVTENYGSGVGVQGTSGGGPPSGDPPSTGGAGVFGFNGSGLGVGVLGFSGVVTDGVIDPTSGFVGVFGRSPGGIGVQAVSEQGLALDVQGKARFSTAGAGVIPAHEKEATVADPAVTAESHVSLTLTEDPVGAAVSWVERQPGVGFVVRLGRPVARDTAFTYLVVEPGE